MKDPGRRCLLLLLLVLFPAFFSVEAAPKSRPRPAAGRTVTLSEAGVKLRMIPNAEIRMLSPPQIAAVRKSDGASFYTAQELWSHAQILAVWEGKDVTVRLAEVKFPPLAEPDKFVPGSEISKWEQYDRVPGSDELRRWTESFSGEKVAEITKLSGSGDLLWCNLQTGKPESRIYFGYAKNNGSLRMLFLFFLWKEPAGPRGREEIRTADNCALSVRMIPRSAENGAAPSAPVPDGSYALRLAQAKKSIAGMRGWYIRETPNYIFVSNQRSRNDMQRLQNELESAREIFRRYFPPDDERSCVGVVKLFGHREEYLRYAGEGQEWTGGSWNTGTQELLVSPLDPGYDSKTSEKFMRRVTLHEGFHQYIYYVSHEINPDLWFNEGCAQFFELTDLRHGDVGTFDKATEARLMAAVDRADDDLARFLSLTVEQFYEENEREQNYALSYALMYYLLRGAPANGDKTFAALPRRYIEALRKTQDLAQARDMALEGIDTRELADRLKRFWRDRKKLRKARRKK